MDSNIQLINIKNIDHNLLSPFILNRFDLWSGDERYIVLMVDDSYVVEILFKDDVAILGSIMMDISNDTFTSISKFVFKLNKKVKKVLLRDSKCHIKHSYSHNYCIVKLSKNKDAISTRLTPHHQANIKRHMRKIESDYGSKRFVEYLAHEIPQDVFDFYFYQKNKQMNATYNMSYEQYISNYHVTNAYVLYFGERITYVAFSCEQASIPFLENHTYDDELKNHSIGTMGFLLYLDELGKKCFEFLYLGWCDYFYKKRFGDLFIEVFSAEKYRCKTKGFLIRMFFIIKKAAKKVFKHI